jgi:hypothetical protein
MNAGLRSELNPAARRRLAEAQLGHLRWTTESRAYCECPGSACHSAKAGKRDCQVRLDGVPTIKCFHASCSVLVAEANRALRSAIGKAEVVRRTGRDQTPRFGHATAGGQGPRRYFRIVRGREAVAGCVGTPFRKGAPPESGTISDKSDGLRGSAPHT